jgi:DNA-directed RNA polymerase specialized sigma24 family protein
VLGHLRRFAARWADDAAAVALLRFQEKGRRSRPLGAQIAWLRVAGRHWIISQLRRPGGRDAGPLPADRAGADASGADLAAVVRDGLARCLRRLRRRLPTELDELIRLRFDAAMTLREIAEEWGGELTTDARLSRVRRQLKGALARLRSGLRRAGLDAIPGEWEGLRDLLRGLPEDQIRVVELFYGTDLSYEEIGERVCPEVDPAGRGSRARRLHRVALVHLLRRSCGSPGGLESRPGRRGPGRPISRGCGEKSRGRASS